MGRLLQAIRAFWGILFKGTLPDDVLTAFAPVKKTPAAQPAAPARSSDGALQLLGILQRDSRLVDFLMEDISGYSDDQVGAAVRNLHEQCRESMGRYVQLVPVLDGVEGSFTNAMVSDPKLLKFVGNVPAQGQANGGILRHRGWRSQKADFPPVTSVQDLSIIAPAEIEIE